MPQVRVVSTKTKSFALIEFSFDEVRDLLSDSHQQLVVDDPNDTVQCFLPLPVDDFIITDEIELCT